MENKSFDDIIKDKLAQFSIEDSAQDWSMLEDKIDQEAFDQQILEGLSGYQMTPGPQAFEVFSEAAKLESFDEIIRNKVSGFVENELPQDFDEIFDDTPAGFDGIVGAKLADIAIEDESDWDSFEKILDSEELAFDQEVKKKLSDYEEAGPTQHWPKLSEHLKRVEKRRKRIIITKFVEAAVFLLIVLSIMQLYPINKIGQKSVYRTHDVVFERGSDSKASRDLSSDYVNDNNKSKISISSSSVAIVADEDSKTSSNSSAELSPLPRIASTDLLSQIVKAINTTEITDQRALLSDNIASIGKLAVEPIPTNEDLNKYRISDLSYFNSEKKEEDLQLNGKEYVYSDFGISDQRTLHPEVLLASLDMKGIEIENRRFSTLGLEKLDKRDRKKAWFNLYGSPQANIIHTPFDKSYTDNRSLDTEQGFIEAYSQIAEGYTLGGSISVENLNYEMGVGLEYTSLNYQPKQITEITSSATLGYKETLLKEIIFDIIEIPVNIKYNIFKKKGWKVYGVNGLSIGVVAFANYDIEEDSFKPLASTQANGKTPNRRPSTFQRNKEFDEGLARSNDLIDNSFITVNVGAGVSKEISDQMSFYIQPTYYHNLSQGGIGPNNDVHHRLALQIGTKVRI